MMNLKSWPSEFKDLAFPSRSSREPDEVGSEDMCELGMNKRAVMIVAERHYVVSTYKHASSAGPRRLGREWR